MKLFVVHPGWIKSINDWQHHFISAGQLMNLYRVRPDECIVWDDQRSFGYHQAYLNKLLRLYPLTGVDYRPATHKEREMIRKRLGIDES